MNNNRRDTIAAVDKGEKGNSTSHFRPDGSRAQAGKPLTQAQAGTNSVGGEVAKLKEATAEVPWMRISAQRELGLAKQIRAEAERFSQETGAKARSQAQLLVLQARLATKKEVAELNRKASEEIQTGVAELKREASAEIQKILGDMRMIRIAAQEELKAQKKFTNAARIRALSLMSQEEIGERLESEKEAISV